MKPHTIIALFLPFINKLKFKNLFLIIFGLFTLTLFIPDFIPFIDEIILGVLSIILAKIKDNPTHEKEEGNLIEGEVVHEENKSI